MNGLEVRVHEVGLDLLGLGPTIIRGIVLTN